MSSLKLGVEVLDAHDLLPKDGAGAASAYVEVHFDGQRFRTSVKEKDLNPVWNEQFFFTVSDPSRLPELALEAFVYHSARGAASRPCLGKVTIAAASFVGEADAAPLHYPLEKRGLFSRVRGELGLRVFLTDDPSVAASGPDYSGADARAAAAGEQEAANSVLNPFREGRAANPARQFQHLPRERRSSEQYYPERSYAAVGSGGPEAPPAAPVRMFSSGAQQPADFQIKETSPTLGGGQVVGGRVIRRDKGAGAYDLVEKMEYLFVRVVKARDLPAMDITGSLDPFVEVRLGNYKMTTRYFEKNQRPEWDEVFAFPREVIQSSTLDVVVKDKDVLRDDYVGRVVFDLSEVPKRVPPDSPLAPEWYRLVGRDGARDRGELMLAVWLGTQADESFPNSIHAGPMPADTRLDPRLHTHIRGKVYPSPRLWYLRVNVIEAQDIYPMENHLPDVVVKARVGAQMLKTRHLRSQTRNYLWNEELMFVVAEPFEDDLIISVEDRVGQNKEEAIGEAVIPLPTLRKRPDSKPIPPLWFDLRRPGLIDPNALRDDKFHAKISLRVCLEGGYHVLDESTQYCSDLRPTMKQLWKPPIGVLEVGILKASGLSPSCNAYCVAKYGQKWVRTRTMVQSPNPRFNEQYTWDVHDHGTVLTVGLFDNHHLSAGDASATGAGADGRYDQPIGKVRIRLSTLETGRVYTHSYPLLVLHPSGVKKTGELDLAIRFSATSLINVVFTYSRPLLPKMHYTNPLSMYQQEMLRHQAVHLVAQRLGRMEPPVRREVVEYMSDAHSHLWSMRRSKANFFRLMQVFSGAIAAAKWFGDVCLWKNPVTTVLVHVLYAMLVFYPDLILPTVFLYMFLIGLWNYRFRPKYPPHMNTRLSHADVAHPDELDEEFDKFPTTRSSEVVRMRYDRLRHVAGRIQTVVGDVAAQGERLQSLLSWRDPRATAMFLLFCLFCAVTLYVAPFQAVALCLGFFWMRHPRFRHKVPSAPVNFFRRLPAKTDTLL